MSSKIILLLIILISIVHLETKFPTDIDELKWMKGELGSKKKKKATFTKKDLDNPDKLEELLEKIEKIQENGPETPKPKRSKRKLEIKDIFNSLNNEFNRIGTLVEPATKIVGVESSSRKDFVNTGTGVAALLSGLWNNNYRQKRTNNIFSVLENKYHLNNLYLNSIEVQNSNAQISAKMLSRCLRIVTKTRKEILSKIHASINPLA